ncbi:hypothetical protein [Alkalibacillus haloalkaliphilus]|uniref:Uncharacterized protein n=1 Tax=Alkalibacillus haloalkaliphilus TaxID=94136 RepID=A0A511W642_9BACI|nr:hypothetical protein [Alkalibacillus haloalkaliphilus]GEN45523.1 hypothetical protein AHA02nite_12990 [Alkalibacillus haloalkaliphilus]
MRFLSAVISAFIIAFIYVLVAFISHPADSPIFFQLFVITLLITGLIYLMAGTPISIFIDRSIKKLRTSWQRYIAGVFSYSLAGAIVSVVVMVLFGQEDELNAIMGMALYGTVAANIYYHVQLWMKK